MDPEEIRRMWLPHFRQKEHFGKCSSTLESAAICEPFP